MITEHEALELESAIMNLPRNGWIREIGTSQGEQLAYKLGHRDARHAATELVVAARSASQPPAAEPCFATREQAFELMAAAADLAKSAAQTPVAQWLPIDTAPKDRVILLSSALGALAGFWFENGDGFQWRFLSKLAIDEDDNAELNALPARCVNGWMPLPAAPTPTGEV